MTAYDQPPSADPTADLQVIARFDYLDDRLEWLSDAEETFSEVRHFIRDRAQPGAPYVLEEVRPVVLATEDSIHSRTVAEHLADYALHGLVGRYSRSEIGEFVGRSALTPTPLQARPLDPGKPTPFPFRAYPKGEDRNEIRTATGEVAFTTVPDYAIGRVLGRLNAVTPSLPPAWWRSNRSARIGSPRFT